MDHEKMMQVIHDIFDPSLPRLAPGDNQSTRRALQLLYGPELERRAETQGLSDLIEVRCADMKELELGGEIFDLVWAEGSAFVMGVPEALGAWRSFLKPGGALGFSELVWFELDPPAECREFFAAEYPPMTDVPSNLAVIEECGYDLAGHFTLPDSSWREPFYGPLSEHLAGYEAPDEEAQTILEMVRREIDTHQRFSRWYGYAFFLLRRRN